jgi:hypothetical protein
MHLIYDFHLRWTRSFFQVCRFASTLTYIKKSVVTGRLVVAYHGLFDSTPPRLMHSTRGTKQTMQLFLLLLNEGTTLHLGNATALEVVCLHEPNKLQIQLKWINLCLRLWTCLTLLTSSRCNNTGSGRSSSNDRSNIFSSDRISRRWETRSRNSCRSRRRKSNFGIP